MKTRPKLDRQIAGEVEQLLRTRHAELTESIRGLVARQRNGNGDRPAEEVLPATESLDDEIRSALLDRRSRQLAQVEAALEQLSRGDYGRCHDCGAFIGLPRLRALPFAQRCAPCQARAERRAAPLARRAPAKMTRRAA
ncbi:MAG TPA: TraR/DksA family transcriptional regulator [Methylomirabilota bacterium]|jgi:DnaK suppressor protein|nr:TraR/DksA family transcriptional regulator [Methylomirabilota bacterium]